MFRAVMILLCLLLAAAAAGRYQAEVSVREVRREIESLDQVRAQELSSIQVLRAEIAYLESPDRLAKIASEMTELEPLTGDQLMTADEFLLAFGAGARVDETAPAQDDDIVVHAIAMANMQLAE